MFGFVKSDIDEKVEIMEMQFSKHDSQGKLESTKSREEEGEMKRLRLTAI